MPKPRKNEQIRCPHFTWLITNRDGRWYADGRSNTPDAGRHSLGTSDKKEALQRLVELDRVRAEDLGLIPRSAESTTRGRPLPLDEGRKLYEKHLARPRVAGGVRKSTQRRYEPVFNKFISFAKVNGINVWNGVTAEVLGDYAATLEARGRAHKTLINELTTLKQAIKWLIARGHLRGMKPIDMKLRKAESEPAYSYSADQIAAMVELCLADPELAWLGHVIIALACTGLRIGELCSLCWSDLDLEKGRLELTDETGRSGDSGQDRRELKNGRNRAFPIHDDLLAVLKSLPRRSRFVFLGPRGGQLKPDTVRKCFVRDVIRPLAEQFPTEDGEKGFCHGRLHSFRHAFCSNCANNNVPERMLMDWLGHADSAMVRRYYHLHDEVAKRQMNQLDFLGGAGGCSDGATLRR